MNISYTTEYRALSPNEMHKIMDDARQLQAEALRDAFVALARGVGAVGRRILAWLRQSVASIGEAAAARESYEQVSRLTGRELADIGLTRGDIAGVAAGIHRRPAPAAAKTSRRMIRKAAEQDNLEQRYREAA